MKQCLHNLLMKLLGQKRIEKAENAVMPCLV